MTNLLPRLLGLVLLGLLMSLLSMSCETTRETERPSVVTGSQPIGMAPAGSRSIVQVDSAGAIRFRASQALLADGFIRQFNDGTVIDRIMVRKAPAEKGERADYYLVGMGLRSGSFRAMALPLTRGGDNTFYLSPTAARYILSSNGCPTCFFNFEGNRITGSLCSENSAGSRCDLTVEPGNDIMDARR